MIMGGGLGSGLNLMSTGSYSTGRQAQMQMHDILHDQLLPIVVGLHRSDKLQAALSQMKENVSVECKAWILEILERMMR